MRLSIICAALLACGAPVSTDVEEGDDGGIVGLLDDQRSGVADLLQNPDRDASADVPGSDSSIADAATQLDAEAPMLDGARDLDAGPSAPAGLGACEPCSSSADCAPELECFSFPILDTMARCWPTCDWLAGDEGACALAYGTKYHCWAAYNYCTPLFKDGVSREGIGAHCTVYRESMP